LIQSRRPERREPGRFYTASAKRSRPAHSPAFKGKFALAALKGHKTLAKSAQLYDVCPNQIMDGKKELHERVVDVFETGKTPASEPVVDVKVPHAKSQQRHGGHCGFWGEIWLSCRNPAFDLPINDDRRKSHRRRAGQFPYLKY
jgi:transposase